MQLSLGLQLTNVNYLFHGINGVVFTTVDGNYFFTTVDGNYFFTPFNI